MDRCKFCAIVVLWASFTTVLGQIKTDAVWCTINEAEQEKCTKIKEAVAWRQTHDTDYPIGMKSYDELPGFECKQANDKFECMERIEEGIDAHLVQLDPGYGYTAGELYTMLPLMAERYATGSGMNGLDYYAVAVVRKDNRNINIENLAGKKACMPAVGNAAGWTYPMAHLIEEEIMPITECNVPVKSAASFFGGMCAPNGLARQYNPFGNNPATVCEICSGNVGLGTFCTDMDPFADYPGAFDCMVQGSGDVAFVRHLTVYQYANSSGGMTANDFELLCPDGSRQHPDKASTCNFGTIASHIVMTSAAFEAELRSEYKELLALMTYDFGSSGLYKDKAEMFNSQRYGGRNLMFTDETKELVDVSTVEDGSRDTYFTWVGDEYTQNLKTLNACPMQQARWCVISTFEMDKCENMIMAFDAKGLKPELNCILGKSIRDCMEKIRTGDADLMSLDAGDVYVAGKYYGMVPIASEDYSGQSAKTYYAVAVARRTESRLTIFNLKGRRTCHSGVWTAAGWVVPVDKLIETGQIVVRGCNIYHTVGQFFSKSCVPGVLNDFYNRYGTNPINLCEACASGGEDRCQRKNGELYYGNAGAFRCLAERGGDVAFVKHTTVRENTDGRNIAEWSRNRRSDDYELLCNDGTRRDIDDWKNCNMGSIPANAIVTAGFKTQEQRSIYWTLLNYAQQHFASDSSNEFSMFDSMLNYADLIFQDSTVRLVYVEPEEQTYIDYLGSRFIRSMERLESIDCITTNSASTSHLNISIFLSLYIVLYVLLAYH